MKEEDQNQNLNAEESNGASMAPIVNCEAKIQDDDPEIDDR